jgi:PAS domain S-box-containing protein
MKKNPGNEEMKTRILVVEDDPLLLKAYVQLLEQEGYVVSLASTGKEAGHKIEEEKPDIVILDVVLPDADGIDMCRQIKNNPDLLHTYIMLVSGIRREGHDRAQGLQAGADSFIPRPISNRELLAHVQSLVRLKQAEVALKMERDFLEQITEISPVALTVVNRNGVIVFANQQAESVLGLTRSEVEGRTYNQPTWAHTDYDGNPFPEEQQPFRQVMDTGQAIYDVHQAIKWPNGERILLSINGAPVYDKNGQIDRVVFSITNMTDQILAQRALKTSEEKLQTLFDHIGDAILIHDKAGKIWDVNKVACEQLGYTKQELKATNLADIDANNGTDEIDTWTQQVMNGTAQAFETMFQHKDGMLIPVEIISRVISYDEQHFIISTARDITERKAIEAARSREKQALNAMSNPPMQGVTAGAFGLRSLKESYPDLFESLISQYQEILKNAVERRIYKVESDISAELHRLSNEIGFARAGPRDVVNLHVTALQRAAEGLPKTQIAAYADEGRLLMVELMGYLTSFYRHRAYDIPQPATKTAHQTPTGDNDDQK